MSDSVCVLLRLADNALIHSHRLSEWCGHGPVLEEDMALTNISLDLIGQARLLYERAGILEAERSGGPARLEDDFAYWRDESAFLNFTLLELPHDYPSQASRDYATTIVRNFLYSGLMAHWWPALAQSSDPVLAAVASKAEKENVMHWRHARDWLVRFGDGTPVSHQKAQQALDNLFPYTHEFWSTDSTDERAQAAGFAATAHACKNDWVALVDESVKQAGLKRPAESAFLSRGRFGHHSESLGYLLAEMQALARAHPGAKW